MKLLLVGVAWVALCFVMVTRDATFPGPDVFQFKGAGVYFAQHGVLGGINMPFAPPNVQAVYAFYPPVHPFLFGLWSKVAGVSLASSASFDLLIRTLRAGVMLVLLWPLVRKTDERGRLFIATSLLLLSLAPNNEDRPDELGLLFGLASWAWLLRGGRAVVGGLLLGLAGATSPAAGLFAAIGAVFVCRRRTDPWRSLGIVAITSMVAAAATIAPIVIADQSVPQRFMDGVRFNAFHYKHAAASTGFYDRAVALVRNASVYSRTGAAMGPLAASLVILLVILWRRADAGARAAVFPAAAAACVFLPITLFAFPKEPLYLWMSCAGLAVAVLGLALSGRRYRLAQTVLLCGMSVFLARDAKLIYDSINRPGDQTLEAAQARVMGQIEPGARLAGWPDTFFTVAGARPIESFQFSCRVLDSYDYVYLTDGTTFPTEQSRLRPLKVNAECAHPAAACFTVQDDFRSRAPVTIFGRPTGFLIRGFGGVLFKRTGC